MGQPTRVLSARARVCVCVMCACGTVKTPYRATRVSFQNLRIRGVDGGAFDGPAEQPLGLAHEELVQWSVESHVYPQGSPPAM